MVRAIARVTGTIRSILYYLHHSVVLTILTSITLVLIFPLLKTVNSNLIFLQEKTIKYFSLKNYFPVEMTTLRNKRKVAALNKEHFEEHPRSNLAQSSNFPRSQEDYITQISEEIEGRFTKKLTQEFSRTKNRILGPLARLDDFLMNPLIQGHSVTAVETSRNVLSTSQGTNEDDSQSDPHPDAGIFHNQMTQNSGPEDGHNTCASKIEINHHIGNLPCK